VTEPSTGKPATRRVSLTAKGPNAIDPLEKPVYLIPVVEPTAARRFGRVFAYFGMSMVWLAVVGVVVFGTIVALPGALGDVGPLGSSPGFHRSDSWLAFIVIPFAVVPVAGYAAVFLMEASVGVFLAAATLFARSLNPAYRHEQLSMTVRSVGGEAVGPASTAVTGDALSLLPVRMTRWTKIVMIVQFNGWIINTNSIVIGYVWGCLYFFTVGWMLWPATGAGVPICAAVSALLAIWLVVTIWRRRRRYPTVMPTRLEGTVYENSWPNRPRENAPATRAKRGRARR
jgi:hypothetical protein